MHYNITCKTFGIEIKNNKNPNNHQQIVNLDT